MIKLRVVGMAFLLFTVVSVRAEEPYRFYDQNGKPTGTAQPQGNVTRYYDANHKLTGYAVVTGDVIRIYDAAGHFIGTMKVLFVQ